MLISIAIYILMLAANWKMYQKMGRHGWESIIPGYNMYVLFEEVYGNGWRVFMLLIPFYGWIVLPIMLYVELAKRFGKSGGYGVGMFFLGFIFVTMLAFGSAKYMDGSKAKAETDVVSNVINNVASGIGNLAKKPEEAAAPAAEPVVEEAAEEAPVAEETVEEAPAAEEAAAETVEE